MKRKLWMVLLTLMVCIAFILVSCDTNNGGSTSDSETVKTQNDSSNIDGSGETVDSNDEDLGSSDENKGESEGLEFTLSEDEAYYILSGIGTCKDSFIVIPNEYNGLPVRCIGASAFKENLLITDVIIPEGVEKIDVSAFESCGYLANIKLPSSVTAIEESAFENCCSLMEIVIPSSVTAMGRNVFDDCDAVTVYCEAESEPSGWNDDWKDKQTSPVVWNCNNNDVADDGYTYVIVDQVRYGLKDGIAEVARQSVTKREAIIASSVNYNGQEYSVTTIINYAFRSCAYLTSVVIPNSVTSVHAGAFNGCDALTVYCERQNPLNDWYFECPVVWNCNNNDVADDGYVYLFVDGIRYRLKDGIAEVARQRRDMDKAFMASNLTYKGQEYIVTAISDKAFYGCHDLASISIPDSVTTIGEEAFCFCYSLADVEIPNSVATIGKEAFGSCYKITSVEIPHGITSISPFAFYGCSSLARVKMPDGVNSIGDSAFYNCYSLASVEIPNSVATIGKKAFYDCSSLTSVVIGNSVTGIGEKAFYNCYKLVEVYNLSRLDIEKDSFENGQVGYYALNVYASLDEKSKQFTTDDGFMFYDDGEIRSLFGYIDGESDIVLPDSCNGQSYEIHKNVFRGNDTLTSVVIPNSVTSIGERAFENSEALTSVVIGEGVTSIGEWAFQGCNSLISVTFQNPNGWYVRRDTADCGSSMDENDLIDEAKAAEYLARSYYIMYWYKE